MLIGCDLSQFVALDVDISSITSQPKSAHNGSLLLSSPERKKNLQKNIIFLR